MACFTSSDTGTSSRKKAAGLSVAKPASRERNKVKSAFAAMYSPPLRSGCALPSGARSSHQPTCFCAPRPLCARVKIRRAAACSATPRRLASRERHSR